ncbi:hypothetical protein CBOM_02602 [Ceraceosorus bombacis]|uniref:S-adenosyl-L-methionine-dependent methyltransferase n=1 Tax=Ceraceosorus bombacis TaxID=401625 RepID=A0A0P1BFK1_9BASI|nr:hypothetical protein CBOM_02602 [Ceraceosorus bombacis]
MGLWDRPALHQHHEAAQPDMSFGAFSQQHDHTKDWWNGFGPAALHQDAFLPSPHIHDFFPTRSFPRACQALASYLIHRASLHLPSNVKIYSDLQGSTANFNDMAILDVGHGCGDSLLLLARTLRPRRLHGVTSLPAHADRARSRLRTFYHARSRASAQHGTLSTTTFEQTNEAGQVWCGDAIEFLDSYLRQDEALKGERYDLIYGLDCAYHFRTRDKFLQLASQRLKPGGVLVLFDLVAAWPYPLDRSNQTIRSPSTTSPQHSSHDFSIFHADHKTPMASPPTLSTRLLHRLTTRLSGVPSTNLKDVSQYLSDLKAAGLQPVEVQDVSSSVFPGFSTFLQGLGKGGENTARDEWNVDFIGLRGFGRIVNRWAKGGAEGAVRAVVTIAKKPRDAQ